MRFSLSALAASRRALARLAGASALAVVLSACSFITGVPDVDRVELTVPATAIAPGERMQASGLAFRKGGGIVTHRRRQVQFSSSNDSVATVSAAGVITGIAPGRVTITATSDGKRDQVELTVRPIPVRQVIIAQRSPIVRLAPSILVPLSAAVIDTNNRALTNRPATWTSLDPTVVQVSAAGVLTPQAVGSARVTAKVDTGLAPNAGVVADTVEVRVTLVPIVSVTVAPTTPTVYTGQTLQFTATVVDSIRRTVTDRRVVWRSSSPVLAIDSLTGLATGVTSPFTVTVTASVERIPGFPSEGNIEDRVTVTVLAPAASARVSSGGQVVTTLALRTGASQALTLTALDATGTPVSNRTFRVTSDTPAVVPQPTTAVPSSYTLTAGATPGTATITVQPLDAAGAPQGTAATVVVTVSAP